MVFLNIDLNENTSLPRTECKRLATVLHETLSLVESVFSPSIRFADARRYAPRPDWREQRSVRFCEACARHGYHSYLHQVGWLSRCPFHMSRLERVTIWKASGTLASQRTAALEHVMRTSCGKWPHGVDHSFPASGHGHVAPLARWTARASAAAARMSRAEVWRSGDGETVRDISLDQVFGRLRTLEPMPPAIEPLFTEPGGQWRLEVQSFSRQSKLELDRLRTRDLDFARIFDFYKRVSTFAANPPPFIARLTGAQDLLRARHGACRCRWRLINPGWESRWIRVREHEGTYWNSTCPFAVALTEMERGWGRADLAFPTHQAVWEKLRLVRASYEMRDAGLIRYTKDAVVSPQGYLCTDQDVGTGCEWIHDSPVTELLDLAARWEIELAFGALTTWLDDIDRGMDPAGRDDPQDCVRLCAPADGLSLIRWAKSAWDLP
jgi:hypothetical protein